MTMDFSNFPREMQIKIWRIVFWEWRNIGEDPWLWKEVTVTLDCVDVDVSLSEETDLWTTNKVL